jgi:hypothetical protein
MTYQASITLFPGNSNGITSNFDVDVEIAGGYLSYLNTGIYDAWCIDKDVSITLGPTYNNYSVFSGTEAQSGAVSPQLRAGFAYNKLDNINGSLGISPGTVSYYTIRI